MPVLLSLTHRPLSLVGENVVGKGLTSCDEVLVLENGEALYPAMLEAIGQAQHKVLLCTYLFDKDATGALFIDALCAARDRGVEVKIIIDGMGEWLSAGRIGPVLKKCGLEFTRFNPVTLYPPALNLNLRSHRKLLIIDNDFAFTGGSNIGDRHLAGRSDSPHRVLDIHFRLRGRIVDELEWAFRRDWHYCRETRDLRPFTHTNPPRPDAAVWSRLVLDGPNKALDRLNDLMIGVISAAQQRVWIMTPYFLPQLDLIGALIGLLTLVVPLFAVLTDRPAHPLPEPLSHKPRGGGPGGTAFPQGTALPRSSALPGGTALAAPRALLVP